jgi:DNA-binding CsgD family transcriptional regulator
MYEKWAPNLRATVSEPGYSARVIDVIQRIAGAKRQVDVLDLLNDAKQAMGVEQAVYVSFIRDDDSHESFRFLLASDWRWCLEYKQHNWYATDPWLLYATSQSEPVPASQIKAVTSAQRGAVELAKRHGMVSACVVPAPSSGGLSRLGVLCLGVNVPGYFEADGFTEFKVLARSLAMELHEWWVVQARQELMISAGITLNDVELLRAQRRGLGSKEIASCLGISPASVDSRWQRLNVKLGVPHRTEAARLAAEYGLV